MRLVLLLLLGLASLALATESNKNQETLEGLYSDSEEEAPLKQIETHTHPTVGKKPKLGKRAYSKTTKSLLKTLRIVYLRKYNKEMNLDPPAQQISWQYLCGLDDYSPGFSHRLRSEKYMVSVFHRLLRTRFIPPGNEEAVKEFKRLAAIANQHSSPLEVDPRSLLALENPQDFPDPEGRKLQEEYEKWLETEHKYQQYAPRVRNYRSDLLAKSFRDLFLRKAKRELLTDSYVAIPWRHVYGRNYDPALMLRQGWTFESMHEWLNQYHRCRFIRAATPTEIAAFTKAVDECDRKHPLQNLNVLLDAENVEAFLSQHDPHGQKMQKEFEKWLNLSPQERAENSSLERKAEISDIIQVAELESAGASRKFIFGEESGDK